MADEASKLRAAEAKIAQLETMPDYLAAKEADASVSALTPAQSELLQRHLRYEQEAATARSNLRAEKTDIELAGLAEQVAASRQQSTKDLPGSGISSNWVRAGENKVDESCANQYKFANASFKKFDAASTSLADAARARGGEDLPPAVEQCLLRAQEAIDDGTTLCERQGKIISVAFEHSWGVAKLFASSLSGESLLAGSTSEEAKLLAEAIKQNDSKKEKEAKRKNETKDKELKAVPTAKTPRFNPFFYGGGYPPRNFPSQPYGSNQPYGSQPYGGNQRAFFGNCYRCHQAGHRASECPNVTPGSFPALPAPPNGGPGQG